MVEGALQERAYSRIRQAVAASTTSPHTARPGPARGRPALSPGPGAGGYLAGRGPDDTLDHILADITPALTGQNLSGRYYGFVTGSTLPIAEVADNIVSALDQNVGVHLPEQTIATEVEDAALEMLLSLLDLGDRNTWKGRTFTTGATGSNTLGLTCAREHVVAQAAALRAQADGDSFSAAAAGATASIGELGILQACTQAGVTNIQVLTSMGHSSLFKAAGIVGLGRGSVKELPHSEQEPWRLDLDAVEQELRTQRDRATVSIIAVSAGEVNTSNFATTGLADMQRLRDMADRYGAWIHVDGAFAIFARALPKTPEFALLHEFTTGIELADSITVDGHKILNVPYDCGMFFTRTATIMSDVCKNPNAAYLATPPPTAAATATATAGSSSAAPAFEIQSPLNIGLENSRRFRALPVYATLLSEGREGVADMVARMVRLARKVAGIVQGLDAYELLAASSSSSSSAAGRGAGGGGAGNFAGTAFVVLFRAKDETLNSVLVQKIHESREWYVSGTKWDGRPACRLAVSSWRVDVEEDAAFVKRSLEKLARELGA
ncbi:pyridoxal phosphate-dependent transferase [Microdochium trichocladiopsis]|uniref:Pyridoxal phosphate-dependent transferase n=1 Tax=Microdochium trichocladiopsis TaxID=1682393 RepID=A0A9P9BM65_9PEZI|nr:pyridoxal phosphate-dependent transferase [Microdochium trichocladiopsis]KAH7025975.1 pyridoxal phosphate-dependent transferase [Microdochium trichocladiopsis]